MGWQYCNSVNDLKKLGSFIVVKKKINTDLRGVVAIKAKGWDDLVCKIVALRDILSINTSVCEGDFSSISNKYLYILENTTGKNRLDNLSVSIKHYQNKSIAQKWRNEILKYIHPDVCNDIRANSATKQLNEIYHEMIQ